MMGKTWLYRVQERYRLANGEEVVRVRANLNERLRAGDLMVQFMQPLAAELEEARATDRPLLLHCTAGVGAELHLVLPVESVLYASVEIVDAEGRAAAVEAGYLADEQQQPAASVTDLGQHRQQGASVRRIDGRGYAAPWPPTQHECRDGHCPPSKA